MFTHLHVHSSFSFLEGLTSPLELVQAAARLGQPALALTDHGRLTGAIEFYDACRESGLHPVLGLELDVALPPDFSEYTAQQSGLLVLLAVDMAGWSNLCRLSSAAQFDPVSAVALPFETLAANSTGLLCLTGGKASLLDRLALQGNDAAARLWLERLNDVFPGNLYTELQSHVHRDPRFIETLSRLSGESRIPTVATHNVYYISSEQADLQRTLAAIRSNRPLQDLRESDLVPPGACLIDRNEMAVLFSGYPEAIRTTQEIADRCRLELPLGIPHFPQVDLPPGITAIQELRRKAEKGARAIYPPVSPVPVQSPTETELGGQESVIEPAIRDRLNHELEVIQQCGYEVLFLVMEEIIHFARRNNIPVSSRGSAASSLVAHCLGITSPDPIRLNLYFERFLNPARATPPDIDTDLCSRRRDEVIDFVYRRFGVERVAMVCTVNRFRRRSALREVAKAYGLPSKEVSAMADSLPNRWYGLPERFVQDSDPFAELAERFNSPVHRRIIKDASALIGLPRHLSIHPGGVVISPGPVSYTHLTLPTIYSV
jgi:DNA polymerase-3 subunit alpha